MHSRPMNIRCLSVLISLLIFACLPWMAHAFESPSATIAAQRVEGLTKVIAISPVVDVPGMFYVLANPEKEKGFTLYSYTPSKKKLRVIPSKGFVRVSGNSCNCNPDEVPCGDGSVVEGGCFIAKRGCQ